MELVMKRDSRGRSRPQEKDFRERRVVRVVPRDENIRKYIKHGVTRVGFQTEGSAEWPMDAFTRNRLRDGDVSIEVPPPPPEPPPPEEQPEQPPKGKAK
jgi:hypothetical protein